VYLLAFVVHALDDGCPGGDLVDGAVAVVADDEECGFHAGGIESVEQVGGVDVWSVVEG
jgi:hypothetical protein